MEQPLPKLKKQTLVDDFITRFEEMILSGKLSIGEKLPSERDLAARLGVSRPVVHEGLIDLASKGLVTRTPTGGAVINDYRKDGSLSMLTSLLNFQGGLPETRLAQSTLEFRALIEVENARLAALNRSEEQLAGIRAVLEEEQRVRVDEVEAIAQMDFRLHHLIAMATNNIFYPLLLNSFKRLYIGGVQIFYSDPKVVPEVFAFHRELVDAIAVRDANLAASVMRRMLEHGASSYQDIVARIKI
jgi:GntR family transcriptional repressor for pyruvate dehydrogenase complex